MKSALNGGKRMWGAKQILFGAFALLAALLLLAGCPGSQPTTQDYSTIDLIQMFHAARQQRETGSLDLLSPLRYYYLPRGWYVFRVAGEDEPFGVAAAASRECRLRYQVVRPAERWLAFSVRLHGRFGGPKQQSIEVHAGERRLDSLEVSGDRTEEKLVRIPAEVQRPGDNELIFRFSEYVENPNYLAGVEEHRENPCPLIAGYFSHFRLYLGSADEPRPNWIRDETSTIRAAADGRRLVQLPHSAFSYAFSIGEGASLVLSGSVEAPRRVGGAVTITVQARTDARSRWRPLWTREFPFRAGSTSFAFEGDLPLRELAGNLAEFRFSVTDSVKFSGARVTWRLLSLETPADSDQRSHAAETQQPLRMADRIRNVVIIVLDAARPDHFGCYGDGRGLTPNIDRFAASSILFRDAVASAPYTIASVSTLFTGLQPERHGVRFATSALPADLENLAKAFNRSGYYTQALASINFLKREFGITRDCDDVIYIRQPGRGGGYRSTLDLEAIEGGVREAADSGRPVFILAHFLPPHWPYLPPQPFDAIFESDHEPTYSQTWMLENLLGNRLIDADFPDIQTYHLRYQNNLCYADHLVEQYLELLRRYGLFDDSLIVVTSDHGEAFGEHRAMDHNSTVYDEMIRVPMIVRMPGVEEHREVRQQVGLIDIFPTLVELLNIELEGADLQGRSIAPLLSGRDQEPLDYYYSRAGSSKLIFTLRGERYKYVHHSHREELYDLINDPGETRNIFAERPVLAAFLRQRGLLMIAANERLRASGQTEAQLSEEDRRELRDLGYLH